MCVSNGMSICGTGGRKPAGQYMIASVSDALRSVQETTTTPSRSLCVCSPSIKIGPYLILNFIEISHDEEAIILGGLAAIALTALLVQSESVMATGYSTNATDAAVQANIVAAGYGQQASPTLQ